MPLYTARSAVAEMHPAPEQIRLPEFVRGGSAARRRGSPLPLQSGIGDGLSKFRWSA